MPGIQKRVILWTCPRSLSTAFLRSIATLPNAQVFHELFSTVHYYASDERRPKNDDGGTAPPPFDPTMKAAAGILKANYPDKDAVFAKEMAYCVEGQLEALEAEGIFGPDSGFVHSFLIRSADRAVYSLYKASVDERLTGWSSFDPSEAGFRQLRELYDFVKDRSAGAPVVIDADDLQSAPEETMRSYCDAVGIGYKEGMTRWEPGPVPGSIWEGWHEEVEKSSGIIRVDAAARKAVPTGDLPPEVLRCIEACMPHYALLQEARILPRLGRT
ncbi:unnamed protein product [Ostreobium quekettii]|uniref:Branched-chain-amino-acid aminotransferase-like protein 2 n=1 Tax=Ostreobium quekettii TaxID=121088 RepID=A0A8S1INM3_9CHLO|nr:unnamed protein product [Ostreobium quekettii]|eukprot:evm.model.scf_1254.5 EVM.evm.TU.scf_1254.5   scf_1254:30411-31226(+)